MKATNFLMQLRKKLDKQVAVAWGEKGPKDTMIKYHGVWMIGTLMIYVQEFEHGFEFFYQSRAVILDELEDEIKTWLNK